MTALMASFSAVIGWARTGSMPPRRRNGEAERLRGLGMLAGSNWRAGDRSDSAWPEGHIRPRRARRAVHGTESHRLGAGGRRRNDSSRSAGGLALCQAR
jgi:hypothetical protein